MATTHELHPIWTDKHVELALHAMHEVLGEWDQVKEAGGGDDDAMEDIEGRFTMALGDFFAAMKQCQRGDRRNRS
jgi:hypothetical protein